MAQPSESRIRSLIRSRTSAGILLVGQARDEFGDLARVDVVGAGMGGHAQPLYLPITARRFVAFRLSHHGQTPDITS